MSLKDSLLGYVPTLQAVEIGDYPKFWLRPWNGQRRLMFDARSENMPSERIGAFVFALSVADEQGQLQFAPDDVELILEAVPHVVLHETFKLSCKQNMLLTKEELETQKND